MTVRHIVRLITLLILLWPVSVAVLGQDTGWQANPAIVEQASIERPGINYVEARVAEFTLPDLLNTAGTSVRSPAEWQRRRAEILELFREHVYGRSPGRPERLQFQRLQEDTTAMAGAATLRRFAVVSGHAGREHRFEITIFLPNAPTRAGADVPAHQQPARPNRASKPARSPDSGRRSN